MSQQIRLGQTAHTTCQREWQKCSVSIGGASCDTDWPPASWQHRTSTWSLETELTAVQNALTVENGFEVCKHPGTHKGRLHGGAHCVQQLQKGAPPAVADGPRDDPVVLQVGQALHEDDGLLLRESSHCKGTQVEATGM